MKALGQKLLLAERKIHAVPSLSSASDAGKESQVEHAAKSEVIPLTGFLANVDNTQVCYCYMMKI